MIRNHQRGNIAAVLAAQKAGFQIEDIRHADDPKGNGKETLVLRVRNWEPK